MARRRCLWQPQKQIPSGESDLSPVWGEHACPKGDLLRPGWVSIPLPGSPQEGTHELGDPPARRRRTWPWRAAAGCAHPGCSAGGWMAARPGRMQAEGLLQTGADIDPIFGGFSSNLITAERETGLKVWVWVANTLLMISGFSREISQSEKVGSVWDLDRPNPIPGFMLFWFL